jgi:hypothetical protein
MPWQPPYPNWKKTPIKRFAEIGTVLDALLKQQQDDFQKRKRIGLKNKH